MLLSCGPQRPEGPHLLWSQDALSLDNPFPDARLAHGFRPGWYQPFVAPSALTPKLRRFFDEYTKLAESGVTSIGSFGGTVFRATEPLDRASLDGRVARLQKVGEKYVVLEEAVRIEHVRDGLAPRGLEPTEDLPEYFMAQPSVPLPEGEEGVLVVRRGPATSSGQLLERGAAWSSSRPNLAPMAEALGIGADEILLAIPQRAAVVTKTFEALAAWADANPATVTVPVKGFAPESDQREPLGVWKSDQPDWSVMLSWAERFAWNRPAADLGQVVVGEITSRDLRENEVMRADWAADPSQAPAAQLRFVLTLPKGPKPAGGWKMVLGAHGATGRNTLRQGDPNSFCMDWAQVLAARGFGCIGIDAPEHGTRGVVTRFFGVENPAAIRDRFRQMTFDLLVLERAIGTIDVDGDGTADLAPDVRYFGNSLGAIMGSQFMPWSRHVTAAVLNVPGAGLSNILTSPVIGDLLGLLLVARTGLTFESQDYVAALPLIRAAGQAFFEPADAINMAQRVPDTRAVLIQEGSGDRTVPNFTTEDLARALRAPAVVDGIDGTTPLRVLARSEPAWFLSGDALEAYDGHNIMWSFEPVRNQALRFLESDGRELLRAKPTQP